MKLPHKKVEGFLKIKPYISEYTVREALNSNDIKKVFELLKTSKYDLLIHDLLVTKHSILVQYYYMKAFSLASFAKYINFAQTSAISRYGSKQIFHNVLTMYGDNADDLSYKHSPSNGLPKLQNYLAIAKQVF